MSNSQSQVEMYDALAVTFTSGAIGTVSGAGTVPIDQTFQVDLRIFRIKTYFFGVQKTDFSLLQHHDTACKRLRASKSLAKGCRIQPRVSCAERLNCCDFDLFQQRVAFAVCDHAKSLCAISTELDHWISAACGTKRKYP